MAPTRSAEGRAWADTLLAHVPAVRVTVGALSVVMLVLGTSACQRREVPTAVAASPASGRQLAPGAPGAAASSPGPVSVGFAQDMSLHHEQALQMAELALQRATPDVRGLAAGILRAQLRELGYLQGWLMLWEAPAASAVDGMPWMKQAYVASGQRDEDFERFIDSCSQLQAMPGSATADELESLSRLKGEAFDERFLALMVRHHEAAIMMGRFAYAFAELPPVRQFGAVMAAQQRQETAWMVQRLALRKAR